MKVFIVAAVIALLQAGSVGATSYDSVNVVVDFNRGVYPLTDSDYWNWPVFTGNSNVFWKSGSMSYSRFQLYGNSYLDLTGGSIDAMMSVAGSSRATIDGGSVDWSILAEDQSRVAIGSGSVRVASAQDDARIIYSGGQIGVEIDLYGNASLDVYGSGLSYNLLQHSNLWGRDEYRLTGLLSDGTLISTSLNLYNGFTGDINFHEGSPPVPEPATLFLFATGGTMLAGRRFLKKRRTEA